MSDFSSRLGAICRITIEALVLLAIVLSPWAFGAVEPWARTVLQGVAALVLVLWAVRSLVSRNPEPQSRFAVAFLILPVILVLVQMVPLPTGLGHLLAPAGTELRESLLPAAARGSAPEPGPLELRSLSTSWERTMPSALLLSALVTLAGAALFHLPHPLSQRRLLLAIVTTGTCLAGYGLAQRFLDPDRIYFSLELTRGGNPFGPYVNRNHFAGFVVMASLVGLGLTFDRARRFLRDRGGLQLGLPAFASDPDGARIVLLGLATILMMASVFLSLSRGGMVALFVGLLVFFLLTAKRRLPALGMLTIVLLALGLVAWVAGDEVASRLASLDDAGMRIDLWKACANLVLAFPVLGVGAGNFATVMPAFQDFPADKTFRYAESDWWHFTAELGLVGLVLCVATLVWLFFTLGVGLKQKSSSRLVLAGLFAALTAITVHGFFDFNLHIPANGLLAVVLAAVAVGLATREGEKRSRTLAH